MLEHETLEYQMLEREMSDREMLDRARALRAAGRSPKEIARALRLPPAVVAPLVRAVAAQASAIAPGERAVVGCWVNPGWRVGLTVAGHPEWPDDDAPATGAEGLVAVLVAREEGRSRVSACGYLVDVYCLGVKNVVGPRVLYDDHVDAFVDTFFTGYRARPLPVPVDLARHPVFGAVEYARGLGFEPAPDFEAAAGHLGAWTGPGAIRFGRDGKPLFVQGPHDDVARVLATLDGSVGRSG